MIRDFAVYALDTESLIKYQVKHLRAPKIAKEETFGCLFIILLTI